MAETLGQAWIGIAPFDDAFGTKAKAIVTAALKNVNANVPLTVDQARLSASLAAAAKLAVFDEAAGKMKVNFDTDDAMLSFAAMKDAVQDLLERSNGIPISMDDSKALAELFAVRTALMKLYQLSPDTMNFDSLAATFYQLEGRLKALEVDMSHVNVDLDAEDAFSKLTGLAGGTEKVKADLASLRAEVSDADAEAKILALQVAANKLSKSLMIAPVGSDFTPMEAQLASIVAQYGKLKAAQAAEDEELAKQNGLWASLGLQGPGSLIHITDILNGSLPEVKLFGGAIGSMYAAIAGGDAEMPSLASHLVNVATSAHLSAEAAIEFTAIWGPAVIAVTAFGAAASPTIQKIGEQLLNMHTASMATGESFKSLATQGQSVVAAVKPSVMEAFGIALYAVQNKSSTLDSALKSLGAGIDEMAAKAAVAFDSKSSGTFFTQGSKDALALMDSFEQVGSILGTLMKAVPGYAEVLLGFGNDALHMGAVTVSAVEPVLAVFLKLHGALLYGGLAGTAASWIFGKIVDAASSASLGVATAAAKILGDENSITKGALGLGGALEDMSAGPVIAGVGLLAGAFAAVVLYLRASKTAADTFNATIQQTVSSSSLASLNSAIQAGIKETTVQYVQAQAQVSAAQSKVAETSGTVEFRLDGVNAGVRAATQTAGAYASGLANLTTEQTNVNDNLTALAKTYGVSVPAALSLASGAQVTSNQLTASGASNLATLKAQVGGYVTQLAVMTAGTGSLNQALNALNVTQAVQVTDAQKLTQAYTSWIGIVTGGDTAFTSFEQGQATLASDLNQGTASALKLTVKVGNLSEQYSTLGASMNGTSTSALAARQAFDQQISAAVSLYGNLQVMAAASGDTATAQLALTKAGKDLTAQLLPMAAGSKEATAEVFALAQIAGFSGVDSFQALSKWVGTTKGAEADLNNEQTILTLSTANLTAAAKNLSAAVGSMVTSAEAAAIAKTENLSGVTLSLAQAFENSDGAASKATVTYAGEFYESLIKAGVGATTAKADVDAFLTQLGASTGVVDQVNKALSSLPRNVTVSVSTVVSGSGAVKALEGIAAPGSTISQNLLGEVTFSAAGGVIGAAGGGAAGRDSKLAMVAPGELVIPTSHAAAFADMARRASIPGFAGGGVAGLTSGLGQLVPVAANATAQFSQAAVQNFVNALKAAQANAAAISMQGVSNASALTALESAAAKAGWTGLQWQALYDVEMREAGFNLGAVNPSSGAYGMAQFIDGPSEYALYGGNSTTAAGQAVAMVNYIKSRYGTPAAALQHEEQFGWYNSGGTVKPYSAGGMVSEPVFGFGKFSGMPYSFAENGPEAVMPASQVPASQGLPPMTQYQGQQLIALLQTMVKQNAQAPYTAAQALTQASAAGVRRGYFATSG